MNFRYRLLIRSRPVLRFIKFRILHVDDAPQRIARGIAIGVFFAYLPLLGLQMILAFVFAKWLKANKALAVMSTWISNPLTAMIIFYPCYRTGRAILSFFQKKGGVDVEQLEFIFEEQLSFWEMIVNGFSYDYWKQISGAFARIGLEILIGGVIIGAIVAGVTYWLSYYSVIGYRTRKQTRKGASKGAHVE
jgi:uncharacterized protein (DUF2062 family)